MKMLALFFVAVSFCLVQNIVCDRVIMTNNGPVQGITVQSEGTFLEAYLGIPFAEPPVGRLRFAKPVPKTPWLGVYDASRLPPTCIQNITQDVYYMPDITNMTEDCLYLNIWVPHSSSKTRLKPILFFIHGGAYITGASNMKIYDGAKMAARGDVNVVTINYRVGAMGFFSAFINEADGNMGLYDQIMALNWVRDNAVSFGGDPDHIVLWGQSVGAVSAVGLILSPLTKHMVKRVILQSGGGMIPRKFDLNAHAYKVSQFFSKLVGCANNTVTIESNPRLIVNCIKRLPAEKLSAAAGLMIDSQPISFIPRSGDAYLPQSTGELIRHGKFADIEMLVGVAKDEGNLFLTEVLPQYFGVYGLDAVKSVSRRLAFQIIRQIHRVLGDPKENEVAEFYINSIENGTSDKYTKAIGESIGDYLMTCNTMFTSEFHSIKKNPVYFYVFSHRSPESPLADWMGVTHFDEVKYTFGNSLFSENFTEEEEVTSRRMMERWLAFAKTGNPNIKGAVNWPLYTYKNPAYLEIDVNETARMRPDNYRCEFWRDRYQAVIDNEVLENMRNSVVHFMTRFFYITVPTIVSTYIKSFSS